MTQPICINQYKMIKGFSNLITDDYDSLTKEQLEIKVKQMDKWFTKNYTEYDIDLNLRKKLEVFRVCYAYALHLLGRLPDNYAHTLFAKYKSGWINPDEIVTELS